MNILNNKKVWAVGILFLMFFGISNLAFSQEQPETKSDEELQAQAFTNLNEKDCKEKINSEWTGDGCKPKECEKLTLVPGKEKETCNNHPNYCTWNAVEGKCGTEKEFSFYTALNAIYETGTGWVSGLVLKSGPNKYNVIVDIPCDNAIVKIIGGAQCGATNEKYKTSLPLYVARLYQFGFGIVGAVALLMIIIGAAKYTLSAGNFTSKDEAKKQITEAIYGILLLFGAYLILYTINPGLVSIKAPTLTPVSVIDLSTPATTQTPTNTNTPTENLGTKYFFIENCDTTKGSACIKCSSGYALISGKCEKVTFSAACASGYSGPKGCVPCSSMNGYSNKKGGCTLCSDGYVVSGEAPDQKCIAE